MKLKKITAYDIENKLCELFVGIFFLLLASVSATICFFCVVLLLQGRYRLLYTYVGDYSFFVLLPCCRPSYSMEFNC